METKTAHFGVVPACEESMLPALNRMHVGEECVRFCSHAGVVHHAKRSAFEACPKEEIAHVGNLQTWHQTAANVGQTGSDGGVRLLPGDLG
ncbi:hypothetical protein LMG9964_06175 [Paraburkholderia phenoliruptrix]|uniref:Uncharacterized protein n=1 Tax=Paraburkholderia phenoliruptrix TaxID=252970 RepID=A0A6J5KHR1_9BURK|nr:hypothetical protein LMG9964_06175 [Paraburkholderia phenoliruptrix]